MANGTPASGGREPRTNVIIGCTDATVAPRFRSTASSSLVRAPLECSATLPFHSAAPASDSAAPAIAPSGTQNQTTSASTFARPAATAIAPTSPASRRARRKDAARPRETICSIPYPASRKHAASAPARFPAPTIAIRGFADRLTDMPGSIAESTAASDVARTTFLGDWKPESGSRKPHSPPCFILFRCRNLPAPSQSQPSPARLRIPKQS